jgi:hypothetical protein
MDKVQISYDKNNAFKIASAYHANNCCEYLKQFL